MSDPDSELTPAQDDAVRELLASARHTDPTPPDVVARLDAALADLVADRGSAERLEVAPVVTLASRRRRTAGTLLLAAAAVVVAGVGIGQVLPNGASDESAGSASDTAMSAEEQAGGETGSVPYSADAPDEDGTDDKQGDTSSRSAQEAAPSPSSGLVGELSALTGDADLKRQVRKLRVAADASASYTSCPVPEFGAASTVAVTYDGLPGALVFRAPSGNVQRVDVFLCGEREALRSLKLRAP